MVSSSAFLLSVAWNTHSPGPMAAPSTDPRLGQWDRKGYRKGGGSIGRKQHPLGAWSGFQMNDDVVRGTQKTPGKQICSPGERVQGEEKIPLLKKAEDWPPSWGIKVNSRERKAILAGDEIFLNLKPTNQHQAPIPDGLTWIPWECSWWVYAFKNSPRRILCSLVSSSLPVNVWEAMIWSIL